MEGIMGANHVTGPNAEDVILAVSLELAVGKWKVALHDGRREKPAVHTIGL
jgi:transposase